jgi:hypothetical protein
VSPEQRRIELNVLAETVSRCTRCSELASTRRQTVFGVGPIDAQLCFIGEAPGADEDRQGEPFVGAAGQLLNRILAACGMKREEVYICNILRCLHGFTKVLTEDGWQQIQRIVARRYSGKVAAVDALGRPVWAPITGYYRSPRNGRNLVRLCLHSSRQGRRPAGGIHRGPRSSRSTATAHLDLIRRSIGSIPGHANRPPKSDKRWWGCSWETRGLLGARIHFP